MSDGEWYSPPSTTFAVTVFLAFTVTNKLVTEKDSMVVLADGMRKDTRSKDASTTKLEAASAFRSS